MRLQIRYLYWILTGVVTDLSARLASLIESMTMALVSEQRFKPRPRFSDDSLNKAVNLRKSANSDGIENQKNVTQHAKNLKFKKTVTLRKYSNSDGVENQINVPKHANKISKNKCVIHVYIFTCIFR
jgi:hypothetical protein